jgi:tRNA (adenine37-N6)-methyltransferase
MPATLSGSAAFPDIRPIGVIRTPFSRSEGAPIQAVFAAGASGRVELFPGFEDGLKDLEGFSRIWLLYRFHRAAEAGMLVSPYLDPAPRGVFATRSPGRPNRIGMSAVRLTGVERNALLISDVDMLDGSQLLDIKPYVPAFDVFPNERAGWYDRIEITATAADGRFDIKPGA